MNIITKFITRILPISLLIATSIISCSCQKTVAPITPTNVMIDAYVQQQDSKPVQTKSQSFTVENTTFQLPPDWNEIDTPTIDNQTDASTDTTITHTYASADGQTYIVFNVEPFAGSLSELVVLNLRDLQQNKINLDDSSTLSFNNQTISLLQCSHATQVAFMYSFIENNKSYVWTCGGNSTLNDATNIDQKTICSNIFNTFTF